MAQVVRFKEMTELQERGGVGHALGLEINAGKTLQGLTVIERVFKGFVSEAIPLLEEIDAQHPFQPDGRATTFTFRIEWLNDGEQL